MTTIKIVLKKKSNKDGTHSIIMRITKDRKSKIITLGMTSLPKDWDEQKSQYKRSHPNHNTKNRVLLKLKAKALKIIDDFMVEEVDFSLNQFEEKFRGSKSKNPNVVTFFNEVIDEQIKSGKIGSAKADRDTRNALKKFGSTNLKFKDITPEFLDKFEVYLRSNGSEDGGIAFRMRHIRGLFNKAIKRGLVGQEYYPFRTYKIAKLKGKQLKRALSIEDFKKIKEFDISKYPNLIEAYDYFMFSFYARGMNFVDMMKLKWNDIQNGRIQYIRSKTKGHFNIEINEEIQKILDKYKKQNRPTEYVFPILLSNDLTPKQIYNRKAKVLKRYNKKLKEIAELAGVNVKLTSYVARHSTATILKQIGTSTDVISEILGHSDVKITKTYLKEFSNELLDTESRKLLDL